MATVTMAKADGSGVEVLLSVGQVAEILGVCRQTAYNWCHRGTIDSFILPGTRTRRVRRTALEAYLSNQEREAK